MSPATAAPPVTAAPPTTAAAPATAAPPATATAPDTRIYRGRSLEELIPKIQAELGVDAIVVRQREGLAGGIGGFFQRSFVELEAQAGGRQVDMYDEQQPLAPTALPELAPEPVVRRPGVGAYVTDQLAALVASGIRKPATTSEPTTLQPAAAHLPARLDSQLDNPQTPFTPEPDFHEFTPASVTTEASPVPAQAQVNGFAAELAAAETAVTETSAARMPHYSDSPLDELDDPYAAVAPDPVIAAHPVAASRPPSRAHTRIETRLLGLGCSEQFAHELLEAAAAHVIPLAPGLGLGRATQKALEQRIPGLRTLPAQGAAMALVGAGGSGKTGCCAALLGAYRKHGALTASCASIVADAQDSGFEMLLAPYVMEPTPIGAARATRALASARVEGLLLLDTPAVSRADKAGIRRLAGLLRELRLERVVLALPATLGATAAAQLLETLRPLGATALAITHADETDQLGVAVEAACNFGLAPQYMLHRGGTAGALTRIDPAYLADRLLA